MAAEGLESSEDQDPEKKMFLVVICRQFRVDSFVLIHPVSSSSARLTQSCLPSLFVSTHLCSLLQPSYSGVMSPILTLQSSEFLTNNDLLANNVIHSLSSLDK